MIDPRPVHLQTTSDYEFNSFLANVQGHKKSSNWESVPIKYEDYELDDERKSVLKIQRKSFMDNLFDITDIYNSDSLSNDSSVHVTGSELQSKCDIWYKERSFRVTASTALEFTKNPQQLVNKFWKGPSDISYLKSIKYGLENEPNAVLDFEKHFGKVKPCGLFISKKYPFLAASPDGFFRDFIIEIKCPYILRDAKPDDLTGNDS